MSKKPEIMAPAGDFVSLSAALQAGADAVYFGIKGLNMRANARNFTLKDLPRITKLCADFKAKAYLTLNTIYFDKELKTLKQVCAAAKKSGVSAVIAWDSGAINEARKAGLDVYLSTQASVSNAEAVISYHKNYDINRFVLARECTLKDIALMRAALKRKLGIKEAGKISIEVFAHGAMCVSVSGRCFMSEFTHGKSANRGECRQPCRLEYDIADSRTGDTAFALGKSYVLSPKDLCTLPFIEKLFEAGVNSLKIEGRGRNAEYVSNTVGAYRKATDYYFENRRKKNFKADFAALKDALLKDLNAVFNRGFSDGFYMGKPMSDWISQGNMAGKKKIILGHVLKYYSKIGVAEISVDLNGVKLGDEIQVESEATGFLNFKIESMHGSAGAVESASKGDIIGVKTPAPLKKGDRVYKF